MSGGAGATNQHRPPLPYERSSLGWERSVSHLDESLRVAIKGLRQAGDLPDVSAAVPPNGGRSALGAYPRSGSASRGCAPGGVADGDGRVRTHDPDLADALDVGRLGRAIPGDGAAARGIMPTRSGAMPICPATLARGRWKSWLGSRIVGWPSLQAQVAVKRAARSGHLRGGRALAWRQPSGTLCGCCVGSYQLLWRKGLEQP